MSKKKNEGAAKAAPSTKAEGEVQKAPVKGPGYKTFPLQAREEVEFIKTHGARKKGDKQKVHPNTAILLRHIGVAK